MINTKPFGINELKVKDIGNASSSKPNVPVIPLAQFVHWKWDKYGAQQIISVSYGQIQAFFGDHHLSERTFSAKPQKCLMLLELANYFQVSALKSCCEKHLTNCVEIKLIDRFFLIDRFGLDNLKSYFLHLDINKLRAFFNANHEWFLPVISKELLYALFVRAMAGL